LTFLPVLIVLWTALSSSFLMFKNNCALVYDDNVPTVPTVPNDRSIYVVLMFGNAC